MEQAPSAFQSGDGENVGDRMGTADREGREPAMGLCGGSALSSRVCSLDFEPHPEFLSVQT